jgi:exosortase
MTLNPIHSARSSIGRDGPATLPRSQPPPAAWWWALGGLLLCFVWAYWGTWRELAEAWTREADYSHGFLVVPLAIYLLYLRWDLRPAVPPRLACGGLLLIALTLPLRLWGARLVTDSADGYSLVLWLCGAVWLLAGWAWLRWSLPCLLFLLFMVPLPYRLETTLSVPLQQVAASLSSWGLQWLGQPAFAHGTTIQLGEQVLEVERECSGLRIFVGIFALAFAYLIAGRREMWENALLLASIIPVALLANATRIVISGLLFQLVSSSAAKQFSHDFAGWVMILLAGLFFGLVLWYLRRLVREQRSVTMADVLRQGSV